MATFPLMAMTFFSLFIRRKTIPRVPDRSSIGRVLSLPLRPSATEPLFCLTSGDEGVMTRVDCIVGVRDGLRDGDVSPEPGGETIEKKLQRVCRAYGVAGCDANGKRRFDAVELGPGK